MEHFTRMTAYVYASVRYIVAVNQTSADADLWFGFESGSFCDQVEVPIFQLPFQVLGLVGKAVVCGVVLRYQV